jgi:DNA replication ATP-dependent helicase Dna2
MKEQELARLYYREVEKIVSDESRDLEDKIEDLYFLLHKLFFDITSEERVHFTTIFSRIAFASHKYRIVKDVQFFTFQFRKAAPNHRRKGSAQRKNDFLLGLKVVCETIKAFYGYPAPESLRTLLPTEGFYPLRPTEIKERIAKLRVVAVEDDLVREMLLAKSEEYPDRVLLIKYNDRRNENFMSSIIAIRKVTGFPVTLNLLDVNVDSENVLTPRAFVVEPDYLVDVTSVADCFKENNKTDTTSFLLNRFLPKENTPPILLGNIANFFLDELVVDPSHSFESLFARVFKLSPFAFVLMSDS